MLTCTHTSLHTRSLSLATRTHTHARTRLIKPHVCTHREKKHIFYHTRQQTRAQTSRQVFLFFYTDKSKIHSHFHFEEGEMALLNTAWRGDLSPAFSLTYKHISAHLLLPFSLCHSLVLALFFPAHIQFPLSHGALYSLFSASSPLHTHTPGL